MLRSALRRVAMALPVTAGLAVAPAFAAPTLISLYINGRIGGPQQTVTDVFAEQMRRTAAGEIIVDVRAGNTLGAEKAILDATRAGAVDMVVLTGSVASSVVPAFGVFDIPFLFRDARHAEAVAHGPVLAALAPSFADKGLVLLAIGKQGFRNMTNAKRPIRSPADVRGLKIRVIPNDLYLMAFKALGAEVVPLDYPLVYGALQDGRIDGQENPIETIAGGHLDQVQKYYTATHHIFSVVAFVANKATFDGLSAEEQATVRRAAQAGADASWKRGEEADAKGLAQLRAGGMEVIETIDRQPFIDAMQPLEPEFERRFGKQLLDAIRATP